MLTTPRAEEAGTAMTVTALPRSRPGGLALTGRLQRAAPWGLVGVPVLFNLWVLAGETMTVQNPNDATMHLAMVQWARQQIDEGHVPLDGWFPTLSAGASQFHHYQTLPHIITAYLSLLFGTGTVYSWSLYLLLALWPISVYLGVRLLGWDKWTAAAAAVVSPLLVSASGYGFEHASYTWRGYGLWPQLWGMWMLPIAWGLGWRAIRGAGSYALAALAAAIAIACHLIVGYVVLLALGVWTLIVPRELLRRLGRAVVVVIGALLIASWVIVPFLSDWHWLPASDFGQGTFFTESFGAAKVLGWLVTGQLYDSGRLPVVSLLVAIGLLVCAARLRRDERARALVAIWLVSLVLFFGPRTLGPIVRLVPIFNLVPLHRLIMGVHMGGIILAGVGAAWLGSRVVDIGKRFIPEVRPGFQAAVIAVVGVLALYPGWTQIATYDQAGADMMRAQQVADGSDGADLATLVDRVRALGPGRVYAGSRATWGGQYTIGYVAVYAVLTSYHLDVVGYTGSVMSTMGSAEGYFDERNAAQYDLFNVRYLVLPSDRQPPVNATRLASQGRHTLWQVDTSGYLEVVDVVPPTIVASPADFASQTVPFLESTDLATKRYHWVAYGEASAFDPTLPPWIPASEPAGSVQLEQSGLADGRIQGQITANRLAVVLLKASFDPRWTASVDGRAVQPQMVAPGVLGVPVGPGHHTVSFRYVPYPYYVPLFGVGLLALAMLLAYPRLLRRVLPAQLHRWRS